MPANAGAVPLEQRRERRAPALGDRRHLGRGNRHAAIPGGAQRFDARGQIGRRFRRREQLLEFDDERFALGELARHRDLMTVVVALEEVIGRRAEARPHRLGLGAPHRADGLPLGLQPLHFGGGGIPVHRLGEGLGAIAERFLLRQVVGPHLLARGEVLATSGEERIARGAEALRQIARVAPRDGAERPPFGLQFLEAAGGLRPIGRLGQRFGLLDDRGLPREIRGAFLAQLGEVRFACGCG